MSAVIHSYVVQHAGPDEMWRDWYREPTDEVDLSLEDAQHTMSYVRSLRIASGLNLRIVKRITTIEDEVVT